MAEISLRNVQTGGLYTGNWKLRGRLVENTFPESQPLSYCLIKNVLLPLQKEALHRGRALRVRSWRTGAPYAHGGGTEAIASSESRGRHRVRADPGRVDHPAAQGSWLSQRCQVRRVVLFLPP